MISTVRHVVLVGGISVGSQSVQHTAQISGPLLMTHFRSFSKKKKRKKGREKVTTQMNTSQIERCIMRPGSERQSACAGCRKPYFNGRSPVHKGGEGAAHRPGSTPHVMLLLCSLFLLHPTCLHVSVSASLRACVQYTVNSLTPKLLSLCQALPILTSNPVTSPRRFFSGKMSHSRTTRCLPSEARASRVDA